MAKKLKVLSDYRSRGVFYRRGDVIEVDEAMAHWLRSDAPGCFEEWQPEQKAMQAPPVDKMVHSAPVTKSRKPLDEYTVAELQEMAKARGIVYSGLRKAELIKALEG